MKFIKWKNLIENKGLKKHLDVVRRVDACGVGVKSDLMCNMQKVDAIKVRCSGLNNSLQKFEGFFQCTRSAGGFAEIGRVES